MKTLITLIFCLFVGCGESDNKENVVNGDTFVHGENRFKAQFSVQLKDVGEFTWHPATGGSRDNSGLSPQEKATMERMRQYQEYALGESPSKPAHYRLTSKQGKLIGTVTSKEEIAKIKKYIGKD